MDVKECPTYTKQTAVEDVMSEVAESLDGVADQLNANFDIAGKRFNRLENTVTRLIIVCTILSGAVIALWCMYLWK